MDTDTVSMRSSYIVAAGIKLMMKCDDEVCLTVFSLDLESKYINFYLYYYGDALANLRVENKAFDWWLYDLAKQMSEKEILAEERNFLYGLKLVDLDLILSMTFLFVCLLAVY